MGTISVRACPACGSAVGARYGSFHDEEYFTPGGPYDYWQCGDCGSLYLHPLPVQRLSEIYPANYYSYGDEGGGLLGGIKSRLDARWLGACLSDIEGPELAVLDVGGGRGWMLDLIRRVDPRVRHTEIVDLDERAGELARSAGHAYSCERVETFGSPRRYHLILLLNLIEHVESPRQVLARLGRMLTPGGRMLVKTPNYDALDARLFRATYWAGLHVPRHWTVFRRESFERCVEGSGLAIERLSFTQGGAFWAASILAAWNRRGLARLSAERPAVAHPAFPALAGLTAAFDYLRMPFARTSQMFIVLRRETPSSDTDGKTPANTP